MFAPRLSWVSSFQATSLLRFNLQSSEKLSLLPPRPLPPFKTFHQGVGTASEQGSGRVGFFFYGAGKDGKGRHEAAGALR